MASYWVIGGEYQSTSFEALKPGAKEVRKGPFATYEQAKKAWSELAWQSVDNCNIRFFIREQTGDAEAA